MITMLPKTKKCITCGVEKSKDNFFTRDGGKYLRGECKNCQYDRCSKKYYAKTEGSVKRRLKAARSGHKVCVFCKKEKPVSEFTIKQRSENETRYRTKSYYFAACKDCEAEYIRVSKRNGPTGTKEYQRKRNVKKYGMTIEDFNRILESQGYKCKICGSKKPHGRGNFHIDHCHKTMRVRGLLCHYCNVALGGVRDDINVLESMILYLRENKQSITP